MRTHNNLWHGIPMYAPLPPNYYALPDIPRCVFRIMHAHNDVAAWNLYWLSKPDSDALLTHPGEWFQHYHSWDSVFTHAFYQALHTPVLGSLTLAALMHQTPAIAHQMLAKATLEKTAFYDLAGSETWRHTMQGRLFLAMRLAKGGQIMHHDSQVIPLKRLTSF